METNVPNILNSPSILNKIEKSVIKESFFQFVKSFWHVIITDNPVWNWHIEYLCKELQTVGMLIKHRMPKMYDLVINIPPGTTKSTICTIMFPVWLWVIDPSIRTITGSYSDSLSTEHAVKSRDIIRSDKFKQLFPEIELKRDSDGKTAYSNTKTGQRVATSVGGTITGKHAHCIIVDDPLNPKQSESETYRKSANDWFDKTLSSRKVDKDLTPTILIMQRLHEDDVTGHVMSKVKAGKKIKHICLPATESGRINPPSLKANYSGGYLDATRLGKRTLNEAKTDLGSYGYSGQYDQAPAPEDGGKLKKSWFGRFSMAAMTLKAQEDGKKLVWNFTVDGAYTKDVNNDPSAIMAWAYFNYNLYVRAVQSARLEFPELVKWIPEFAMANGYTKGSRIYIEPKASGLSAAQSLKKHTPLNIVVDKPPTTDKLSRVQGASPFIESGRCFLLKNGIWVDGFLDQCGQFPNAKHDDEVDTLVMAVDKCDKEKNKVKSFGNLNT